MSWVNGQMSASKSWSYTLAPREVGVFTIGSAEIDFGGDTYRTDPIEVEGGAILAYMAERDIGGLDLADYLRPQLLRTLNGYRAEMLFEGWGRALLKEGNLEDYVATAAEEEEEGSSEDTPDEAL